MEFLKAMFTNPVVVASLLGWTIAQVSKTIIHMIINRKFEWERMVGGGGMPSSHSATVCALATSTGMVHGGDSTLFAITCVFAFIVMYDAMNVRLETGKQGKVINEILATLKLMEFKGGFKDINPEKQLKELVGHTPFQVLIGAIMGVIIAIMVVNYM